MLSAVILQFLDASQPKIFANRNGFRCQGSFSLRHRSRYPDSPFMLKRHNPRKETSLSAFSHYFQMDYDESSSEYSSGSEYTDSSSEEEEEVEGNPFAGLSDQRLAFLQQATANAQPTPPPPKAKPAPVVIPPAPVVQAPKPAPVAVTPPSVTQSTPPPPPSHQVNLNRRPEEKSPIQEKRQALQAKAHDVEQRITSVISTTTNTTGSMNELASKLANANAEVETSKDKASQAEKEKNVFKNKAYDLAARLSAIKKKLQEKEEETTKLEAKNHDLEAKVNQLKQEVKSTETHLNKSYNDTLEGLTNHIQEAEKQINELDSENSELRFKMAEAQRVCKYLQNKLTESEKNHAAVTADTQFKMTEAQRVSKFLESKLHKMVDEKKAVEAKVADLEGQVKKLKQEIGMKDLVIQQCNEKMKQKDAALADASRSIVEVEGKLAASQKVCGFLESTLSKAEAALQRRGPHPEAVKEINALKKKLAESNDLINSLNDGLNMARVGQKTMVDRVGGLEDQVTSLSTELAEQEEAARGYKTKWEIELDKASDLKEQIQKLKKISEDTKKDVKTAQAEKEALSHQLKSRVGDLEGNLKVFSSQVSELSNRVMQVETEKKQWQVKAETLEGDLQKAKAVVGQLKTKVEKTEAEKEQIRAATFELEAAMADTVKIEDLQAQVAQAQEDKKALESKAEVLQVQLATICDILREHKPEIAEMFDQEDVPATKTRGAGGFVQSMFGNKAVLAVTMAAAIVGVVVGDYSHKPRPAFVGRDLVQDFDLFEPIVEPVPAAPTCAALGIAELPCFEFDEVVETVSVEQIAEDIEVEMKSLQRL